MVSKVEHGTRGMPARQWKVTDDVCHADGALVAAQGVLADADRDHRARCRDRRRASQRAAAQAEADALRASPVPHRVTGHEARPDLAGVSSELAEELMQVVTRLARSMGRRDAMRVASWALAAVGLSGLNLDDCARMAQSLDCPRRVDARVVQNLAITLAHCKRQEDALGPSEVLETVVAQHNVARSLLAGGVPDGLRRPLLIVTSNMASAIGGYHVNLATMTPRSAAFGTHA